MCGYALSAETSEKKHWYNFLIVRSNYIITNSSYNLHNLPYRYRKIICGLWETQKPKHKYTQFSLKAQQNRLIFKN